MPAIHEQITAYLREIILESQPGAPLPTEAELTARFECSRWSVRKALGTLRNEGLIRSGQGRRSLVVDTTPHESFEGVISAGAVFRRLGYRPGHRLISAQPLPAGGEVARQLGVREGENVIGISRVRMANGRPVLVEHLHFPWEIGRPLLDLSAETEDLHAKLLADGVDYQDVERHLEARPCPAEEAPLLGLNTGEPLLCVRVQAWDRRRRPIEYSTYHYRFDAVSFAVSTHRHTASPLRLSFHHQGRKGCGKGRGGRVRAGKKGQQLATSSTPLSNLSGHSQVE